MKALGKCFVACLLWIFFLPPDALGNRLQKGRIYGVFVGVNVYKESSRWPALRYAEKDVEGVYQALTQEGRVSKEGVSLLLGKQATLEAILEALDHLKNRAEKSDTVLLMFAGHGENINNTSILVTYDTRPEKLRATGLRSDVLSTGWKSERVVVMLDACHSGSAVEGVRGEHEVLDGKNFQGSGRVVLSSSRQSQKSYESPEYKHGLFSYSLIEALKGQADENGNGVVTVDEAYSYVYQRVTKLSKKMSVKQEPTKWAAVVGEIALSYPKTRKKRNATRLETSEDHVSADAQHANNQSGRPATLRGLALAFGSGGRVDLVRAYSAYAEACNRHDGAGCFRQGWMLWKGETVSPDKEEAEKLFEKAHRLCFPLCSSQKDGLCCYTVGFLFSNGYSVPKSHQKAKKYYAFACDHGEALGCLNLGGIFQKQKCPKCPKKAIRLFKRSCSLGNGLACANLGLIFMKGKVVNKNLEKARNYCKKSCSKGTGNGCYCLGLLLHQPQEKEKFYRKACDLGVSQACEKACDLGVSQACKKACALGVSQACK